MPHTLITFLGRTPRGEQGYRTTCYDFGDGGDCEPLAFFGWALQRRKVRSAKIAHIWYGVCATPWPTGASPSATRSSGRCPARRRCAISSLAA